MEAAFFRTSSLPAGFTAKGGRFFSGFGYLNEVHAHAWDFIDQPLVYQALFVNQMAQDGVQIKWLAPTDLFIELGAESGNGGAFPGTRRDRNSLKGTTLFAHVGGDLGDSTSWRAGGSWIDLDAEDRSYEDADEFGTPVLNAFTGRSRTWAVDAKPSLVARARTADLLVANGAEPEIGWLPVLVRESGNKRSQPGSPGYFEAAAQVRLLEKPTQPDRSMGDIHPQGNPHLQLDPRNIAIIAKALTARILVLASDPHGGENLKDLLAGQILWVSNEQLIRTAVLTALFAAVRFLWRERIGRVGFYVLFALAVTASVQLVGVYLVFTTLIVPAVATYRYTAHRQRTLGYALAIGSYLVGLAASVVTDPPSSAVIVWVMAVLGLLVHLSGGSREQSSRSGH